MRLLFAPLCTVLLLSACVSQGDSVQRTEFTVPEGEHRFEDARHGKELWFAIGAISGAPEVSANGVAQAHYFENGIYRLLVQLNIEQAPQGYRYDAWLVPASGNAVLAGRFTSTFGDVRHSLSFETENDLRSAQEVQVTLELDDENPALGKVVATARLTPRPRE
jgi:hypothetical protein